MDVPGWILGISIHALLAESDSDPVTDKAWALISIHALLAESDHTKGNNLSYYFHFYPRSPCGERLSATIVTGPTMPISIHALLAESDNTSPGPKVMTPISIHALLAESDAPRAKLTPVLSRFLSTLSLRRATYFCGPAL